MQNKITCPGCGSHLSEILEDDERRCLYCGTVFRDHAVRKKTKKISAGESKKTTVSRRPLMESHAAVMAAVIVALAVAGAVYLLTYQSPAEIEKKISGIESEEDYGSGTPAENPAHEKTLPEAEPLQRQDKPGAARRVEGSVSELVPLFDSIGGVYFTGFYRNTGEEIICFPKVTVTLYDSDNTVKGSGYGYGTRGILLPGEETIVRVLISNVPEFDHFDTVHSEQPPSDFTDLDRGKLEFLDAAFVFSGGGRLDITGKAVNISAKSCRSVMITAVVIKDGRIAGTGLEIITDTIRPGKSEPFSIYITSELDSADSFVLDYQADLTD